MLAFGVAVAWVIGCEPGTVWAADAAVGAARAESNAAVERTEPPPGFVSLFNDRDLTGWEQHGGRAVYGVENGAIVGRTVAGTPNSFLCTKRAYTNFIFQFEFEIRAGMNSGVQFRSLVANTPTEVEVKGNSRKIPADRVYGYQYELDPSARAFTGGIYDEGRRGWLVDLKEKPEARAAFRAGVWNQGRIECRGDSIRTWINGVPAAELRDALTPAGFFALQVHGIGTNRAPGEIVRWRRLWIQELP